MNSKLKLLAVCALGFTFVGCGNDISGTYRGTETISKESWSIVSEVTVELTQKDETVTGIFRGRNSNGSLTASIDGDSITNVNLHTTLINPLANQTDDPNSFNQYVTQQQVECPGLYTGAFIHNDGTITGTLNSSGSSLNCFGSASRSVQVVKQGEAKE